MTAARSTQIALVALAAALLGVASLAASACLDTSPITVIKDASVILDGSCTTCLEVPTEQHGCLDVLSSCRSDPSCAPILACIEALSCFDQPNIDLKLNCGVPCLQEAGITVVDDPRVTALLEVVKCGQRQCAVACNLGDAGIAFDAL